jgi:hypothetical protein
MKAYRLIFAALSLSLAFAGPAAARRSHSVVPKRSVAGGWDGRWAGAWGGKDATAVIVKGGQVVAYEYGGATNPVSSSRVTPRRIVYGENDIVVTLTRTGVNSAHATIKSGQGNGTAELVRQ